MNTKIMKEIKYISQQDTKQRRQALCAKTFYILTHRLICDWKPKM